MPKSVLEYVKRHSTYYVASTNELRISASDSRSQADNVRAANDRLQGHLIELLSRDVEGDTSDEQRKRVKGLIEIDRRRTRLNKERRKDVKGGRRISRGAGF
jgi:peptidyl-tRNA hydrolase ICT1